MKLSNLAAVCVFTLALAYTGVHAQGGPGGGGMGHGPGGGMGRRGFGGGQGMMGGNGQGRMMPPAMMMKDADMKVENTPSGAIIRYTSSDPDTIKKIQENAALMKERHDSFKTSKKEVKKDDAKSPEEKPADAKDGGKKDAKKEPGKDAAKEKPKDKETK